MFTSPYLDRLSQTMKTEIENEIENVKKNIEKKTMQLEHLKSLLDENLAHRPIDNPSGRAINDLEEREALLIYFTVSLGLKELDKVTKGLFWDYSNVFFICDMYGLDCPQWFIDKYCCIGCNK
jgi:hypothetical protein